MRLYFAAPLFNPMERSFNADLTARLEDAGHDVFLPQRNGIETLEDPDFDSEAERMEMIFELDRDGVVESDAVVAVLDGRVPDEGVMIEIGIAHENDIPVLGLKTDDRVFASGESLNAMIHGALTTLDDSVEALLDTVDVHAE
ncbi:nucleoside 2-deoxyribosyltransferase [Halarchaeum nitratireducens]|uniref:Nucleoside 2-deoxyribosyltransferase n=1 Tax=Halarchaeum nitratireducens TaxID=489913 RepID=A0A830GFD8_9EURY|nr:MULTISPECIES: nucleoside 2-deoxyribosyltransferase [Halarchaeum]MBP2252692.1 nucleoside 2-deoxyribosyltransferase [Halarchaeum solikamskense]GGN24039.1 nucleoside 2-deoxyribosyltransferase [Halarchaeum nitratireducens]